MKEIILKQYVEVRRAVKMRVDDETTEQEAAEILNNMSLERSELPDNAQIDSDWVFISSRGIEDKDGNELISAE